MTRAVSATCTAVGKGALCLSTVAGRCAKALHRAVARARRPCSPNCVNTLNQYRVSGARSWLALRRLVRRERRGGAARPKHLFRAYIRRTRVTVAATISGSSFPRHPRGFGWPGPATCARPRLDSGLRRVSRRRAHSPITVAAGNGVAIRALWYQGPTPTGSTGGGIRGLAPEWLVPLGNPQLVQHGATTSRGPRASPGADRRWTERVARSRAPGGRERLRAGGRSAGRRIAARYADPAPSISTRC